MTSPSSPSVAREEARHNQSAAARRIRARAQRRILDAQIRKEGNQ